MAQLSEFFSHGIGKIIGDILQAIYHFLYPANTDPARTPEVVDAANGAAT